MPIVLVGASYFALSLINAGTLQLPLLNDAFSYLLLLTGMVIGSMGEETGWRGYLLPQLQSKFRPLMSSVILGALWGVWHLDFSFGLPGFLLYTVTVIELSILIAWLYNKTNGNLTVPIIFHIAINLFTRMFLYEQIGLQMMTVEAVLFGIACFAVVMASG